MDQLTSVQLSEWEAYDRIDPIGTWRDDFRMAYLCSIVTNIAISVHGKKGSKHIPPIDFMPRWDGSKEETAKQSVEEMKSILMDFANAQNRRVARQQVHNKPPVKKGKEKK